MSKIYIEGPVGKIEGMIHYNRDPKAPVAIVLHPHPLYGGTMNNKLVYHMYKHFIQNNFSVIRINFRGVGKSEGKFDSGKGETDDVSIVIDWLHNQLPEASHFWVAGFSFGAYIAMNVVMRRPEIESFIAVAPPVTKYSFSFFSPCPVSGIVVQGDADDIALISDTDTLISLNHSQKSAQIVYRVIESADHFFSQHMDEFDNIVDTYIKDRLANRVVASVVKQRKRSKGRKKKAVA
jgi:alpha/beta superfamily hydrolase